MQRTALRMRINTEMCVWNLCTTSIARESRSPPYPLLESDICGDYVFGVLDQFPRRLRDMDSSQSNLTETLTIQLVQRIPGWLCSAVKLLGLCDMLSLMLSLCFDVTTI